MSSLTTHMGMKLGPLILGTLLQHFLRRETATKDSKAREELLFDEAFIIVRSFMEEATRHTVEEIQAFSNTRIPSPPWVRTVRIMIPMTCCDEAADRLIEALGGPETARSVAGGVRWWQVRGLEGVPGEWIAVRKDIHARRQRQKIRRRVTLIRAKSARTVKAQEAEDSSQSAGGGLDDDKKPEPHVYSTEMDGTPCMLYIHGGGGYFGSVDQERYMMHRYARKISGRVFAINYRLAPQYPFPCALQDVLSAYLYLINPPPEAYHTRVDPSLIVIAGDSAGGNLVLALLQLIRDTGLEKPAGAVLISPWCDMTHSFPSCHTNTASDIIPPYGLALHKPSTLWPPPAPIDTAVIRERMSSRLQRAIGLGPKRNNDDNDADTITLYNRETHKTSAVPQQTTALGDKVTVNKIPAPDQCSVASPNASTVSLLLGGGGGGKKTTVVNQIQNQKQQQHQVEVKTTVRPEDGATVLVDGKVVTINSQIQFYATNHQLTHPYVSPALAYLGGLPPCLFIASDKEVLRDEIIYCAHKAAHPERYPLKDETREFYPAMVGIEQRHGPTDVHLQVYDETCHVLPMFSFTTPAKYCFRAIATFCKIVTDSVQPRGMSDFSEFSATLPRSPTTGSSTFPPTSPVDENGPRSPGGATPRGTIFRSASTSKTETPRRRTSLLRRLSLSAIDPGTANRHFPTSASTPTPISKFSGAYPTVTEEPESMENPKSPGDDREHLPSGVNTAGNPAVYERDDGSSPYVDHMIRERISTQGEIRPLEPEEDIPACNQSLELTGVLNEKSVRRYIEGQTKWQTKFAGVTKSVEKSRQKNLKLARREGTQALDRLKNELAQSQGVGPDSSSRTTSQTNNDETADEEGEVRVSDVWSKTVLGSRNWTWGWILDGENPPPSSIASRRDTEEARRLSKVADKQLGPGDVEHNISGNHLWSVVVEALATYSKDGSLRRNSSKSKAHHTQHEDPATDETTKEGTSEGTSRPTRPKTHGRSFSRFLFSRSSVSERRNGEGSSQPSSSD